MSTNIKETSEVVDIDLNELLAVPGAESVLLPNDEEKKNNVFSKPTADLSFLQEENVKIQNENKEVNTIKDTLENIIEDLSEEEDSGSKGRPKVDKSGTVELVKKLIEANKLIPFDDEKPIEEYTLKDYEELFEANFQEKETKIKEQVTSEFFESLPTELQYAAKYIYDGGNDLKGLFRALSQMQEARELDPTQEEDQEVIVRNYLQATNFGTAEEIEEEIESWKDRNDLESKARKFKPKLDKMQEQIVSARLAEQEEMKRRQEEQANKYMNSVYETLKPGEINGVKLDKKTQELLYSGLVSPSYPSISGRRTNLLGHLLEKYQFVEPKHDLIAEALWLLADPDGYKNKIKETGKAESTEKTVRMLKTEQANKNTSSPNDDEESNKRSATKKITRPTNIFKR